MIYQVIARANSQATNVSLTQLCSIAGVSRSGYYSWYGRPAPELSEVDLLIRDIFLKSNSTSGYRTIKMVMERKFQLCVNHKKIRRSMRLQGLITQVRKKRQPSMTSEKSYAERAFPNLVKREFDPIQPDMIYSGDVTEFKIQNSRKIYLYAAKDLYTKEIVAYDVSYKQDAVLVTQKLGKRFEKLPVKVRELLVYHTDQGGVFMSDAHINMTKRLKVTQSMSRRGNCLDNAPIESFFGHLKDEIDLSDCDNIQNAKKIIDRYMYLYNNERPQWGLNRRTPAECRGSFN